MVSDGDPYPFAISAQQSKREQCSCHCFNHQDVYVPAYILHFCLYVNRPLVALKRPERLLQCCCNSIDHYSCNKLPPAPFLSDHIEPRDFSNTQLRTRRHVFPPELESAAFLVRDSSLHVWPECSSRQKLPSQSIFLSPICDL